MNIYNMPNNPYNNYLNPGGFPIQQPPQVMQPAQSQPVTKPRELTADMYKLIDNTEEGILNKQKWELKKQEILVQLVLSTPSGIEAYNDFISTHLSIFDAECAKLLAERNQVTQQEQGVKPNGNVSNSSTK